MIGKEHRKNPSLSVLARSYVSLFGYPALGLHVRAKAIIPLIRCLETPSSILDAGCGQGAFTFLCARRFKATSVLGIDIDKTMVYRNSIIAKRLGYSNCSFHCKNVFDMAPQQRFDCILSTDNLEHVENDRDLLTIFFNLLNRGGTLLLHVPHITRHVFCWTRQNFMDIEGHVRPGYTKNSIENLLRDTGFTIRDIQYNYNSFETLFNDISYYITKGREKNRTLYALVFPILLLATKLCAHPPVGMGSSLVIRARRN